MRRREFIGLATGAVVGWPRKARAQQARKVPVIGFLTQGFSNATGPGTAIAGLTDGLRKEGYLDGETIRIEARWGEGKPEPLAGFAEELVRLKVDVLVANARSSIEAAKAATRDIPIVAIDLESDPVASGYVASLGAPGGNITGLFLDAPDLTGKLLQLVRDVVPDARRIAVLWDANTGEYQLHALSAAAKATAVDVQVIEFRSSIAMEPALTSGLKEQPQALIALGSPIINGLANRIAEIATTHRTPSVSIFRSFPDSGGLMSYGPILPVWFQHLGRYVAIVLKGAKPAEVPVYRPNDFQLILNLKAATAMGITFSSSLLAQANEVIE
jgi:putative tryptophan/tyrosine transport system substrate-binding protein